MSAKSDELRERLPGIAAEMGTGIGYALTEICRALAEAERVEGAEAAMYRKGLRDALTVMRRAKDGHDRFKAWLDDVLAEEPDACGLTASERNDVLRRGRAA